jgi:nicotinamidase-related amidase
MSFNPSEMKKYVNKDSSVLVVWDVQETLVNSIFNKNEFINKTKELITEARSKGIPIIYTKITPFPEKFESPLRKGWKMNLGDIVNELKPEEGDLMLNKNTASIFVGTNVELLMRNADKKAIIFTGIATEIGVESSARHAFNLGIIPVIAKEAVSSRNKEAHERSLANMSLMFPVLTNQEILEIWK